MLSILMVQLLLSRIDSNQRQKPPPRHERAQYMLDSDSTFMMDRHVKVWAHRVDIRIFLLYMLVVG
jgi:hypothetical protein